MDPKHWVLAAVISKTQGRSGELLLKIKKDFPEDFELDHPIFIPAEREDEALPFYLEELKPLGKSRYIARIDLVDDEERASRLLGLSIWIPRTAYPGEEIEESILERVQGFRIIDKQEGEIGRIEDGLDRPEQPLAFVGPDRIPIPLSEELISEIDTEAGIIYMELPEGLIDLSG